VILGPNIDAIIGRLLRRMNRQYMSFPETAEGTPLPEPDPTRRYLLYLHIPFCVVLCPFCSFHRVRYEKSAAEEYFECLRKEIRLVTEAGYSFDELYIGGGTPTVAPEELVRTIDLVCEQHSLTGISVETNPDDIGKDGVRRLRTAGVNRLSVGVQSFDDALLKEMDRYEKYGNGAMIEERLRQLDGVFDTLNVDMIFNLPHQSTTSLQRDLRILTDEIGVDQVSWYPLMTVDSTKRKMLRTMGRVDPAREKTLYRFIAKHMLNAGYERTSAWCFSRKAGMFDEYIVERRDYLGLGSGAFSYLSGSLYSSTFSLNHYRRLVQAGKTATVRRKALDEKDRMGYYLLMQLFSGSISKGEAESEFEGRFQRRLWAELTALRAYGAIRETRDTIQLTEKGYYLWVMIMREFFAGVNNLRDQMRHSIASEHGTLPTS
jgi:coproporphyrinogen III oxidase-like Fe-S oxidoreductase